MSEASPSSQGGEAVRVGVIGVGSLGYHHARLLREIPRAELRGVYDIDDARTRKVASELGINASPDLEALLGQVEAVTIAVPTSDHLEVGRQALQAGCHVLVEKPIATTVAEADQLIEIAADADLRIQVGHIERFNSAVRACERYLEDPLFVESHRLAPFVRRGTDVPVVLDLMIHDIDLILSLVAREVSDLRAVGVSVLTPNVDIANARLEFDGGAVANITASRVSIKRERKIRFFQPSGYLSLDLGRGTGEFYRRKNGEPPGREPASLTDFVEHVRLRGDEQEPLRLELEAFLATVRNERPVAVTADEGRRALAVALDIIEHIERHQRNVFDSITTAT